MNKPDFTLDKIKFATDGPTFEKAVFLYENGNGRPWVTVALIDLPLKSIEVEATVNWHYFDGDDVKLIINNTIEKNLSSKLWRDWVWHAVPKQLLNGPKKEQKVITKDLPNLTISYINQYEEEVSIFFLNL